MPILFKFYVHFRYKTKHTQTTSTTGHYAIHIIRGKEYEMVIWERNCKSRSWFLVYCFPLDFLNLQPFAPPHLNCYLRKHACPRKCIDRFTGVFENNFPTCVPCQVCPRSREDLVVLWKWAPLNCAVSNPPPINDLLEARQGMVWNFEEGDSKPESVFAWAWCLRWGHFLIIHTCYPLYDQRGLSFWKQGSGGERERHKADFCQPH